MGYLGESARDLLTGEPAAALDPRFVKHLEFLVFLGNNGYARGTGQTGARAVLRDLHADGLLERALPRECPRGAGRLTEKSGGHRGDDRPDGAPDAVALVRPVRGSSTSEGSVWRDARGLLVTVLGHQVASSALAARSCRSAGP
jgi:hypothetical protein